MNKQKNGNFIQLSEDVLYFPGHANLMALNLGDSSLLIDCGRNFKEATLIKERIESLFENKIEYVVLTHFHSDHTHSLPLYEDCQIIASKHLLKILKAAKRKPSKNHPLVFPNKVFDEKYILKAGSYEIIVKETGGHTPDSTYVYSGKHKVLAVGDNLRSDFLWGGRKSDPDKWISALKEYVSFDTDHIIIGHGEIMTRNEVDEILNYVLEVKEKMVELIKEKLTNEEIIDQIKDIPARGQFRVFIHEDTIVKWFKYWQKQMKNK
jgi:glyoxylase-like metal-dependent hydrolase (beta-lactamase superfamily II)